MKEVRCYVTLYDGGAGEGLLRHGPRTVQYYDGRGILTPSALSEGGRRLYSEDDLRRLKVICFLRELGLPIASIGQLLAEEDPGPVITLLIAQQEETLRAELRTGQERLSKLSQLAQELKAAETVSVETIGDIAMLMKDKAKLKRVHRTMLLAGVPLGILQWGSIALWIVTGIWWPFLVFLAVAVPGAVALSRYYFDRVAYLCPQCHTVFRPGLREAFFARHTPRTRRLTCPGCGHHGFCVETCAEPQA